MTEVERQILLNQIAVLEALSPMTVAGADSTRELILRRYRETAKLIRESKSTGA